MTGESHRALREKLGAYALGQLSGGEWHEVQAHLETCGRCRADLDEIAPAAALLAQVRDRIRPDQVAGPVSETGPPPLSPGMLELVRHRAGPPPSEDPPVVEPARRNRRRLVLAAAAALLVVGGAGFVAGSADRGATGPAGVPVASRALDGQVQARTSLVAHTWGMEIKIAATGFAPGQVFRVSVTDNGGRTVGAGEFIGTGATEMRCNLNSSVLRKDASAIEVTDAAGQLVLAATL